jgi:membrane protein DedA with SNARE-associated domain
MSPDQVAHILIEYRYWILIPISLIEGPIVAFVAGTLASLGYFNILALTIYFIVRDVTLDSGYYALGYFGSQTRLAKRVMGRIGVDQELLRDVKSQWEQHAGRTMLLGKLSYGIASSFIVIAGTVNMSLLKFYGYGVQVAILQYVTLLSLGYYFGSSLGGSSSNIIEIPQYLIGGVSIVAVAYFIFSRMMRKRVLSTAKI